MAARVINLVLDQGVDFEATFTLRNQNNTPLNLTGYSASSKIKKHPNATKFYPFVVTFPDRLNGVVKVSMGFTATSAIEGGRYVYDIVLTSPNAYKSKPIQGNVLVVPGVS